MVTAFVYRLVCTFSGCLYPAYVSYKAIRSRNMKEVCERDGCVHGHVCCGVHLHVGVRVGGGKRVHVSSCSSWLNLTCAMKHKACRASSPRTPRERVR